MKHTHENETSSAVNQSEKKPASPRRSFLKATAGVAAATAAFAPRFDILAESAKGANERLGIGFIGTGT